MRYIPVVFLGLMGIALILIAVSLPEGEQQLTGIIGVLFFIASIFIVARMSDRNR